MSKVHTCGIDDLCEVNRSADKLCNIMIIAFVKKCLHNWPEI